MEFLCEMCDAVVFTYGGTAETRCPACIALGHDPGAEQDEGLRSMLHDSHEKGRAARSQDPEDL